MKKLIFIVVLLIVNKVFAQGEKNAENITNEITEVLDLSEKDSEKVYVLALERVQKVLVYRKENSEMSETEIRENIKPYVQMWSKNLRALVGDDNMKKLGEYFEKKKSNK